MNTADNTTSTLLVVDHRHPMAIGWPGETALDCGRSVALDVLADCRRRSIPVGLVTVGDAGITAWEPPAATEARYRTIGHQLRELKPTAPEGPPDAEQESRADEPSSSTLDRGRAAWALRDDESTFATTVRAFVNAPVDSHRRIEDDQLLGATTFATRRLPDRVTLVMVADDSHARELRHSVDLARKRGNRLVVHLAPRVLFEPRGLADAATTYRDYRTFARLRRELERHRCVEVHHVTPW